MATHRYDVHIGSRIRLRRIDISMSQTELANRLGISYQQLQKYETASNRISASRLIQVASILGVSIPYFYEGLVQPEGTTPSNVYSLADHLERHGAINYTKQNVSLQHHFSRIRDNTLRNKVLQLVIAMADSAEGENLNLDSLD